MMNKIAVIGAAGMLGQAVCALLPGRSIPLDIAELDITDRDAVLDCPDLREAEAVINCAAYTNVEKAESEEELATRINGLGVANLAEAAKNSGAFLVHVSTDFVFGAADGQPLKPDHAREPLSAYGRSKLAGELALEESGADFALVRTAWLYGKGGGNFVRTMLRLAKERGELSVVCDQVGSPTYAEDLARELIALAEKRAGGIYHGVNSGAASWHQFACEIVRLSNLQVPVEPITSEEAETRFGIKAKRPAYSVLDCSSLTAATGIAMQPWQEALAEYIEYLRQNPG